MLDNFCGSLSDLFPINKVEPSENAMLTTSQGRGLRIRWTTSSPNGQHMGFELIIAAITTGGERREQGCHGSCFHSNLRKYNMASPSLNNGRSSG